MFRNVSHECRSLKHMFLSHSDCFCLYPVRSCRLSGNSYFFLSLHLSFCLSLFIRCLFSFLSISPSSIYLLLVISTYSLSTPSFIYFITHARARPHAKTHSNNQQWVSQFGFYSSDEDLSASSKSYVHIRCIL